MAARTSESALVSRLDAATRASAPRANRDIVPRQRLFRLLDEAAQRGAMIWVCGGPGVGKTTLLASYLSARGKPAYWVQLGPQDVDGALVIDSLQAVVSKAVSGVGRRAVKGKTLAALVHDLPHGSWFVLDGAHAVVRDDDWHQVLDALAQFGASYRVAIASRRPPPATMARLSANRELAILRGGQLRLNGAEHAEVCRRAWPDLSSDEVAAIGELALGWAGASMLLVALAKRLAGEATQPQSNASCDLSRRLRREAHGAVFNYIDHEVLAPLPAQTRTMMMATAFLPRFTALQAQRLSGVAGCEGLLARLVDHDLFVGVQTDDSGATTYVVHPLVAATLRQHAAADVDARDHAVRVAISELEADDDLAGAFDLAAGIGLFDDAWGLVQEHADRLIARRQQDALLAWLDELEPHIVDDGWLSYFRGVALSRSMPPRAIGPLRLALAKFIERGDARAAYTAWADWADVVSLLDVGPVTQIFTMRQRLVQLFGPPSSPDIAFRVALPTFFATFQRQPTDGALAPLASSLADLARESHRCAARGFDSCHAVFVSPEPGRHWTSPSRSWHSRTGLRPRLCLPSCGPWCRTRGRLLRGHALISTGCSG